MSRKLSIAVICGGQSAEHVISIQSARNIVAKLDSEKYQVVVIYVTNAGHWHLMADPSLLLNQNLETLLLQGQLPRLLITPGSPSPFCLSNCPDKPLNIDCFFPMIHGTHGEDGCIQGLLELLNKPFVGCGVMTSSICMDKAMTKTILTEHGIPSLPSKVITASMLENSNIYSTLLDSIGCDMVIKPNCSGSSIGINRVKCESDFMTAVTDAFCYDTQVLVERFVVAREFECAVLGFGEQLVTTEPAEIILQKNYDLYSFDAKYQDPDSIRVNNPAIDLDESLIKTIRNTSEQVFRCLSCSGMLRVDFLQEKQGSLYVNEVNTIPGFTDISLYPKMWEVQGKSLTVLLDELVTIAMQRHQQQQSLKRVP